MWAPLTDDDRRAIRRMKARDRDRAGAARRGPRVPPQARARAGWPTSSSARSCCSSSTASAPPARSRPLDALRPPAVLDDDEAGALVAAHRFCDRTRNRWFLVRGAGPTSLPTGDDLGRLAHSLGTTATDLRDEYRRVTRRARRVVESRFYGR